MNQDEQLDVLFASYRQACPDPEASPDFMPRLWQRIEARRSFTLSIRRLTQGFVTAAAALCLLMVVYLSVPQPRDLQVYTATYVETLAADQAEEELAYVDVGSLTSVEGTDVR